MTTETSISDDIRSAAMACVGNRREVRDTMAREPAEKLAAVFGCDVPWTDLPPTWHWGWFNSPVPTDKQGPDLHERTGAFLPAVPYPRRMWAAGDVTMLRPLRLGIAAHRVSTIEKVAFKQGASGGLCFATVRHSIEQAGALCIDETQVIVYRDRGPAELALRQPEDPVPEGFFIHPEGQLFFYSCVTHNGHRIHWDRDYCRSVEGYPDLVAHGPMMATELCEAMRDGFAPLRFAYRAEAPVFTTTPVRIETSDPAPVRTGRMIRSDGVTSMTATLIRL